MVHLIQAAVLGMLLVGQASIDDTKTREVPVLHRDCERPLVPVLQVPAGDDTTFSIQVIEIPPGTDFPMLYNYPQGGLRFSIEAPSLIWRPNPDCFGSSFYQDGVRYTLGSHHRLNGDALDDQSGME